MALKIIHTKNLKWVDITNPEDSDLLYLKDNFRFHPLDFDDMTTVSTRAKIDEYDEYHFIILLFPLMDRETHEIKPAEVNFFLGKNYLVTVHDGSMKTLVNLVKNVASFDNVRMQYMSSNSGFLLFSILELLFKRSFPILDKLNHDISRASSETFELDIKILHRLAELKKNIIVYRRIMKMHKYILYKLGHAKREYLIFKDSKAYFGNLIETAESIWDVLASDKESVESFEETNQSLASHHINDVLQILTVVSVVVSVLSFTTNILIFFEKTGVQHLLGLNSNVSLLLFITSILSMFTAIMLVFFKQKGWLK